MSNYNNLSDEQQRSIHQNLRRFRAEYSALVGRNVSAEEIAEASGIKIDTLRAYENGRRNAKIAPLLALSRIYGRPIEHFFMPDPPPAEAVALPSYFKVVGAMPEQARKELDLVAREVATKYGVDFINEVDAIKKAGRRGKKR